MEAVFSNQHSAVSEEAVSQQHSAFRENQHQHQHQHQRRSTTEDTEATHPNKPKAGSLGTPVTEGGKTLPLSHGKPGDEHEHVQQRANALAVKLAQTYEELSRLLERNPGMKRQMTEGDAREDKIYQRLKQRLKMADMAPRCQWVKQDGTACRSPQMKQHIYCFAHRQMAQARELMLMIPVVEDANAIQVGLMRIQKALIEDTISMKKAGLLLYSMQLAMTNVGQTTFGQAKDEEMVRETVDEDDAFREKAVSNQQSAVTETQNQTFETQRNGGSGGGEGLPRMDADERGLEKAKPIFWKPTPDMYRMDTPEGREAYEGSLGVKIKPRVAAAPHECAEVHAIVG